MTLISSAFGNTPGMQTPVESFEAAYSWGPWPRYFISAYIGAGAADPTNTPTWELRPGLLLGKVTATGQWVNYSPTATDGSNIAAAVLTVAIRMQDVLTGTNTAKFFGLMVSGGVQSAKLIGLDNQARAQMGKAFIFDDNLPGNLFFDWLQFQNKTANYQILASDNGTLFTNLGAVAEVDFTLPAIANGYKFGFSAQALGQTLKVISSEGSNIIALNTITASSVAFQTGSQQAGGSFCIYSNPAGTKWIVQNSSAGANTVTVA